MVEFIATKRFRSWLGKFLASITSMLYFLSPLACTSEFMSIRRYSSMHLSRELRIILGGAKFNQLRGQV